MKVIFPRMETFKFHGAYDGGSKFIQFLTEELVKLGVEVEIVTTRLRSNPGLEDTRYNGVKYTFLKPFYTGKRIIPGNMFYKIRFGKNLNKYLLTQAFDILHNTEAFAYQYMHNKSRKPVIFQCWAMEPWHGKESLRQNGIKKMYTKLLQHYWGYCIRNAESVAADDKFQVPRITNLGVDEKKIWFIPNGVSYKKIQEHKKVFKNKREELGFSRRDFVILSVCQIAPDKGIEDILDAFVIVKKEIPNAKLIMIGRGTLEPMMYEKIKKHHLEKNVTHRKNIPEGELYDYHFSSDMFVSAVTSEDFMISIQEGMAAGLPIVSSAQPFLVKDGTNGYVVGFNNPKRLAEGIIKVYKNKDRKKMGFNSKKMARQYDYDILAKKAINEYKKILHTQTKK